MDISSTICSRVHIRVHSRVGINIRWSCLTLSYINWSCLTLSYIIVRYLLNLGLLLMRQFAAFYTFPIHSSLPRLLACESLTRTTGYHLLPPFTAFNLFINPLLYFLLLLSIILCSIIHLFLQIIHILILTLSSLLTFLLCNQLIFRQLLLQSVELSLFLRIIKSCILYQLLSLLL